MGVMGRRHDPDTTPRRGCRGHSRLGEPEAPSGTMLLSDLNHFP